MTYPYDVPGYVQGFRFADDDRYYDADSEHFHDLAGYDHLGNGCDVVTGSPTFETVNGHRALRIDNSCHLSLLPSVPWQGSVLVAGYLTFTTSGTVEKYPLLFGGLSSETSNGNLRLRHDSGFRRLLLATPSGGLSPTESIAEDGPLVAVLGTSQETRSGYSTQDGVTVTTTGPASASESGNAVGLCASNGGQEQMNVRFGDLLGDGSTTAQTDLYAHFWEMHFFKTNILVDHLTATKAVIDRLKAKYGV